jgi:hypothetical protein
MPYAPGITYRAGDYFAAAGPRIAENIQNYQKNREERQQATTTAEMIGRYLRDDPHAIEMFGPQMEKIHSMSTGALKGVIGSATMYMADKLRKAQMTNLEEDNRRANEQLALNRQMVPAQIANLKADNLRAEGQFQLNKDAAALKADEDRRLGQFNQLVNQHFQRPANVQVPYAAEEPTIDANTLTRYAAMAGVDGHQAVNALIANREHYGNRDVDAEPVLFNKGGWSGIFSRRTGALQARYDQGEGDQFTAQPILDPEGNVRGYGIPGKNGGVQMLSRDSSQMTASQRANVIKTRNEIAAKLIEVQGLSAGLRGPGAEQRQRELAQMAQSIKELDAILAPPAPKPKAGASQGGGLDLLPQYGENLPWSPPLGGQPFDAGNLPDLQGMESPPAETETPPAQEPAEWQGPTQEPAAEAPNTFVPRMGDLRESLRGDRVEMIHPDGGRVAVRADQVEAALRQGFKRAK